MATGMVQRADGSWFYEDTSPAHMTYDQWQAMQPGGQGATPPGPTIVQAPVLPSAPEQGPVNAKAYAASQGKTYDPVGLQASESQYDPNDPWWSADKSSGPVRPEGWHDNPEQGPQRYNLAPSSAPQEQPYTPPQNAYGGTSPSGDQKEVWGASYGGMGEDPYLKSMKNFSQPFKQFFSQMQLDHF